jgi:hypothetical protein
MARVVMVRHASLIDLSVLPDYLGNMVALIAPVVNDMTNRLMVGSTRLYVAETIASVLDPEKGETTTG